MRYSIIINTCDKFEDCWFPFFHLLSKYWPNCKGKLYLNTERKTYEFPGLQIHSTQVCKNDSPVGPMPTWSECFIRALNSIDDEIVLYMQEDYFLQAEVRDEYVEKYVRLMSENPDINCIQLTDQAVIPEQKSKYEGLYTIQERQRYRVSCQAALWRKSTLLELLRSYEDAWQFEEFASRRSVYQKHNIYVVAPELVKLGQFEILPYIFTGIVQGRWYEPVVDLFAKHSIPMDFKKRGFVGDAPRRSLRVKLRYFFKRLPTATRSRRELFMMAFRVSK